MSIPIGQIIIAIFLYLSPILGLLYLNKVGDKINSMVGTIVSACIIVGLLCYCFTFMALLVTLIESLWNWKI